MTGPYAGQTGRDLAYRDKYARAFPATQCRPTYLGTTIFDQQQYSTHDSCAIGS